MHRLIAVDGNGCHIFVVDVSEQRYRRPTYMEALHNSIEMVFKKLKYHKGKMDITITEVEYDSTEETKTSKQGAAKTTLQDGEEGSALGPSGGKKVNLERSKGKLQTYKVSD